MMALVGNRTLNDDVATITLCLVERILSSGPLAGVRDGPDD